MDVKTKVRPVALFYGNSPSIISVKIKPENTDEILNSIEDKWKEFLPYQEYRMSFMDESFADMYSNVSRMRTLFTWFSALTILIACLGLFTLSAYMSEQRSKEMSIRKVLGASAKGIFSLLTKQFIMLVGIAFIIAVPITLYFMDRWLRDYEYRIDISWQTFVFAGIFAISISIVTIGFHAIKSAITNPIKSLRTE
jgi:putative ABC transport system permease protein